MQTAEHRSDDNRLAQVLMANARRYALPDPLMGSSLIEVDLVLANQRIQVSVTEQDDVVEHLSPATTQESLRDGIHVGGSHRDLDDLRPGTLRHTVERGAELVVTVARAYEHRDPYNPRPIWQNFVAVFKAVDKGSAQLGIPAYNGGLFREVADLEGLEISDELCGAFNELGAYDFGEDVSVEVLGHIFEQSITDLGELRREADQQSAMTVPEVSWSFWV
jgi:hypothetical protein